MLNKPKPFSTVPSLRPRAGSPIPLLQQAADSATTPLLTSSRLCCHTLATLEQAASSTATPLYSLNRKTFLPSHLCIFILGPRCLLLRTSLWVNYKFMTGLLTPKLVAIFITVQENDVRISSKFPVSLLGDEQCEPNSILGSVTSSIHPSIL